MEVIIVRLKVIQLHLSILKPLVGILEHLVVETFEIFKLILNVGEVLLENCFCCLLLNFKHSSHFLELIFELGLHILRLNLELVIN